jgi:hypothetical protein
LIDSANSATLFGTRLRAYHTGGTDQIIHEATA